LRASSSSCEASSISEVNNEDDDENYDFIVQAYAIGGATFGLRRYLTGIESFPDEAGPRQMATQYFFSNRLSDLVSKVPVDERDLSPITDVHKNPLHLAFCVSEQFEECCRQIESIFKMNGKIDEANTNARFEVIVVRK
jgi:hypothetical protein